MILAKMGLVKLSSEDSAASGSQGLPLACDHIGHPSYFFTPGPGWSTAQLPEGGREYTPIGLAALPCNLHTLRPWPHFFPSRLPTSGPWALDTFWKVVIFKCSSTTCEVHEVPKIVCPLELLVSCNSWSKDLCHHELEKEEFSYLVTCNTILNMFKCPHWE